MQSDDKVINYNKVICFDNPTILVLGNEGRGIRKSIEDLCDTAICIPKAATCNPVFVDSVNVSVCLGILLGRMERRNILEI